MPVITVEGLRVSYNIQKFGGQSLKSFLMNISKNDYFDRLVALDDINLSINPGESWGLMGVNGSGKSTLLKAIAGIIKPDKGSIKISGKLSPIIGLGMGIEPEYSGYENMRLCGTLMGLSASQIRTMQKEVEEFSELGKAGLEKQVKRYSAGMVSRLTMGIAWACHPDILLVDEALSVGDIGFQHKSAERLAEFRKGGGTLLFVSHSTEEVQRNCTHAVLLQNGKILNSGNVFDVSLEYVKAFE